jgi:hypothetical protein
MMKLSRRTLLRGAGVTLGLPWLESMAHGGTSAAAKAKGPVRMAALYMPNGVNVSQWKPEGTGRDWQLSPTLEPLRALKDRLTVMSNLWNAGSKGGDGHYVKEAAILTCTTIKKTQGADLGNGISVDQMAAQSIAGQTPLPSLELGVTPVAIGVDAVVGYTRVYGSHIAWANATTPLAREINPRSVYERLFRATTGIKASMSIYPSCVRSKSECSAPRPPHRKTPGSRGRQSIPSPRHRNAPTTMPSTCGS